MLNVRRTIPATVFIERGAAVDPVFIPVTSQQQTVALVERQVVLPVHRIPVGVEHAAFVTEFVEGLLAVFAVTEFNTGFPCFIDTRVDVTADTAHIEFVVWLLLDCPERVVEFAFATIIQRVGADLDVIAECVAKAHAKRLVSVLVMVAVAGV
ncbi:hypothetical protein D3C75_808780 [compost metagenome]